MSSKTVNKAGTRFPGKRLGVLILGLAALLTAGCEKAMRNMYDQPKYSPLAPSQFFSDGRSSRTPPPDSLAMLTGGLADSSGGRRGTTVPVPEPSEQVFPVLQTSVANPETATAVTAPTDLPIALTPATYRRGRERYEIYCAPCHGLVGDGDGRVVERGFPAPPSYHSERLRQASNQHFQAVITQGYGAMYPYADRISPPDRWAIVAYIRALQLSQHAPAAILDADDHARLGDGHG